VPILALFWRKIAWICLIGAILETFPACSPSDAGSSEPEVSTSERGMGPGFDPNAPRVGVVALHGGFAPDPRILSGVTETTRPATELHKRCDGFISQKPDVILETQTSFLKLHIIARSEKDPLMIAVKLPSGSVVCSRFDRKKKGALLAEAYSAGRTEIFIGTKENNQRIAFTLGFSELEWRIESLPPPSQIGAANITP
jgi:hypothetical protein